MKIGIVAASLLLAACFGARASAEQIPDKGITAEELAKFMTGQGDPATIETNGGKGQVPNDNASIVASKIGDIEYVVQLYDCKDGRCTSLLYEAGWNGCSATVESINQWNSQRRWLKGNVSNNTCFGSFDIIAAPGTSYAYLADTLALWKGMVQLYLSYLNTGAISRRTPDAELNSRLSALEIGKTKYSAILNAFGRPASETHLAEGGRRVTYSFAQASGADPMASFASGNVVTMTFDESGRLENLSPSLDSVNVRSSDVAVLGIARNTLH